MRVLLGLIFVLSLGTWAIADNTALPNAHSGRKTTNTVTIVSGGTSTGVIDLGGYVPVGVLFPATFTGTALTFQTSETSTGTFRQVYNSAGAVSYTVAQARYYALNPADFWGVRYIKLTSGSTEGADRSLILHLKDKD